MAYFLVDTMYLLLLCLFCMCMRGSDIGVKCCEDKRWSTVSVKLACSQEDDVVHISSSHHESTGSVACE